MNTRIPLFAIAVFTLCACAPLESLLRFEQAPLPVEAAPAAPPPPAASAPPEDAWCQRVAASERQQAQQNGFDAATLDRMTVAAYRQCRGLTAQ